MTANGQLAHWDIWALLHNKQGLEQSHWGTFAVLPSILYLFVSLGCKKGCAARKVKVGLENYAGNRDF